MATGEFRLGLDRRACQYVFSGSDGPSLRCLDGQQYGRRSAQADVTDRVRKMIRDNSLDFRVNSDTLGRDPSPGGDNELMLTSTYLGTEHTVVVKEGGRCRVP